MAAAATYRSVPQDGGGVVFFIESARASIFLVLLASGLAVVCGLMGFEIFSNRNPGDDIFGYALYFLAFAGVTTALRPLFGRGSQTVVVDAKGLQTDDVELRHGEFVDLRAVDPTAERPLASWTAPPVVVDGRGRVDRAGTFVSDSMAALQGIGAMAAHRQSMREVRIEARRQGSGERITLVTGLTAETAVALVRDIGQALRGGGAPAAAPSAGGRQASQAAAQAAPSPPSRKVFEDSPEGWRILMAEAERRGWRTSSGLGGVRFVERKTGREVVASRIAEARQGLGI